MIDIKPQSTYGIAKALHHVIFGREYFEAIIRDEKLKGYGKQVITNYSTRLEWIVKDVFSKLSGESADLMREELKQRDIASIDSVLNMLLLMTEDERLELEDYITDKYINK